MTLEGSRAKLRRAKEHLDYLDAEIIKFLSPNPYKVAVQRAADKLFVVRVSDVPEHLPFEDWALIAGDCVHNMRAALDYIAWQLAGSDLDDRSTQFPIIDKVGWWEDAAKRRIKKLPLCAQAMIREVQPCFTGGETSALNGLRLLDDADKHKLLTITGVVHDKIHLNFKNTNVPTMNATNFRFFELPIDFDAVLATIELPEFAPSNVQVEARFSPAIAFSERLTGRRHDEVVPSLRNILKDVTTLVNNFDGKFFAGYGRAYAYAPSREIAAKMNRIMEERARSLQGLPPSSPNGK